jgi:hypothetical protein
MLFLEITNKSLLLIHNEHIVSIDAYINNYEFAGNVIITLIDQDHIH